MSSERPESYDAIFAFVLETFMPGEDAARLTGTTPLMTGGVLSSLGAVQLVTFLEETYGVAFEPWEIAPEHIDTLDAIVALVEQKRAAK